MTEKNALTQEDIDRLSTAQAGARDRLRLQAIPRGPEAPLATSLVEPLQPVLAGDRRTLREWICPCGGRYRAARRGEGCGPCLERAGAEAAAARASRIRGAALAGAGEDFAHVTLDHPRLKAWVKPSQAIGKARAAAPLEYDEAAERWPLVLLLGGTGAGKTTLGTAIYRWQLEAALAQGGAGEDFARRMVWISARELSRVRRESPLGKEPLRLIQARMASVLLLDDLGQEAPADQGDLIEILSERQKSRARTIVTCGFSLEEIATRYGDHFERRLTERAHKIELKGKEKRTKEASDAG